MISRPRRFPRLSLLTLRVCALGVLVVQASPHIDAAAGPRKGTQPRRVSTNVLDGVGGAQRGTQAEPYLAVNPEDPRHMAAIWQENRYVAGSAQGNVVAVSTDGGRRWTETVLPGLTFDSGARRAGPWDLASDPWIAFGPDGELYANSLVGDEDAPFITAIVVNRSLDGGETWSAPVVVTQSPEPDFNDKNALAVDRGPESRYRGRVYVAWDVNVLNDAGNAFDRQDIYVAWSSDQGASFEAPVPVRSGVIGGGVIPQVDADGRVYLMFTAEGVDNRYAIYVTSSRNGGRQWRRPVRISDIVGASVEGVRDGFSLATFLADPSTGRLFVAWQDSRSGVARIMLSISEDGGKKWSAPRDVTDAAAEIPAFTPALARNERGEVAVGYYSLENDPTRSVLADFSVRVSEDGAETFADTFRLTRRSFDLRQAARSSRGWFLGDYVGLAGTDRFFQALWISTRTAAQPDVWTARTR